MTRAVSVLAVDIGKEETSSPGPPLNVHPGVTRCLPKADLGLEGHKAMKISEPRFSKKPPCGFGFEGRLFVLWRFL